MWLALGLIVLFAISPVLIELVLHLIGRQSNTIPFLVFWSVPIGLVLFVVWLVVAAYRNLG